MNIYRIVFALRIDVYRADVDSNFEITQTMRNIPFIGLVFHRVVGQVLNRY